MSPKVPLDSALEVKYVVRLSGLCMAMYDYVGLCTAVYGCVGLCMAM